MLGVMATDDVLEFFSSFMISHYTQKYREKLNSWYRSMHNGGYTLTIDGVNWTKSWSRIKVDKSISK